MSSWACAMSLSADWIFSNRPSPVRTTCKEIAIKYNIFSHYLNRTHLFQTLGGLLILALQQLQTLDLQLL